MRLGFLLALLATAAACTDYRAVAWRGEGTWAQARAASSRGVRVGAAPAVAAPLPAAGPVLYRVRTAEQLADIASRHGLQPATLARANGLVADAIVPGGQFLRIPAGAVPPAVTGPEPVPPALPAAIVSVAERAPGSLRAVAATGLAPAAVRATTDAAAATPPALSGIGFLWPVDGALASGFGERPNGQRNNGIDIAAAEGTAVRAAENGVVVYAGSGIAGYGNMLLLSHAEGFMTAYAHNRDLFVRVGEVVVRGQEIAAVGATGRIGTPQLHFEIRAGKRPVDPMLHLASGPTRLASRR